MPPEDIDMSLIVAVDTATGETFVSLEAISELEAAVEILTLNLKDITDCLERIKAERERMKKQHDDRLHSSLG